MEFDRDLAVQVGITVAVVAVFIAGLGALSGAYGGEVPANETLEGDIEGIYEGTPETGNVSFVGVFENDIEADLDGSINLTAADDTFDTGEFDGTISGAIDGTASGTVTDIDIDEDESTLDGEFEGTAEGTTGLDISADGGLVLLGLMAAFIILMPAFGYLIQRLRDDEG